MGMVCRIYKDRPQSCKDYPRPGAYLPRSCSYFFPGDGTRQGQCNQCGACCSMPRVGAEPDGSYLSEDQGGSPCRHLDFEEEP